MPISSNEEFKNKNQKDMDGTDNIMFYNILKRLDILEAKNGI